MGKNTKYTQIALEMAKRNLTAEDLAKEMDVTPNAVNGWMRGSWLPSREHTQWLENRFKCRLVFGSGVKLRSYSPKKTKVVDPVDLSTEWVNVPNPDIGGYKVEIPQLDLEPSKVIEEDLGVYHANDSLEIKEEPIEVKYTSEYVLLTVERYDQIKYDAWRFQREAQKSQDRLYELRKQIDSLQDIMMENMIYDVRVIQPDEPIRFVSYSDSYFEKAGISKERQDQFLRQYVEKTAEKLQNNSVKVKSFAQKDEKIIEENQKIIPEKGEN